jgi:hypothetical protein
MRPSETVSVLKLTEPEQMIERATAPARESLPQMLALRGCHLSLAETRDQPVPAQSRQGQTSLRLPVPPHSEHWPAG